VNLKPQCAIILQRTCKRKPHQLSSEKHACVNSLNCEYRLIKRA